MESIASKLRTRRESLNISLEQISEYTHISIHHLRSLESGLYSDLPGGMYNRAILRVYCDEIGLDKDEILRCYDDEAAPRQEKPFMSQSFPAPSRIKFHSVAIWSLILIFGICIYLNREWFIQTLSPYFPHDFSSSPGDLTPERSVAAKPPNPDKTVNSTTDEQTANVPAKTAPAETVSVETAPVASPTVGDKAVVIPAAPPEQTTVQPARAADNANLQPLRLEIVGKEECWLSVNSDESGAVTKILSPGDVISFTAARTISIIVGNAGGITLRINDRAARALGQKGEVVHLTIDKNTLSKFLDPSTS